MSSIKFDFPKINVPNNTSRVYKDECILCFDSPESEGGLNVCLNTFQGFCPEHTKLYFQKTNNRFFLNIKRIKLDNPEKRSEENKPTKLAIGVEGGFNFKDKFIYEDLLSLVCLDPINQLVPLPNADLPEKVKMSIDGIIGMNSASKKDDIVSWEEKLKISKYTGNLVQLNPDNISIPRSGWVCGKCDKTNNLWLCLTCGHIGCGRKYEDGSGGNNHAIDHNKSTGHPLVVKLGTITPDGKADVWDYFENDLVENPNLDKHLKFFGINVSEMKKTDKTLTEMQLDVNLNFDSVRIQASGADVFGPGLTGLKNLGNTCYMASVFQTLFNIPNFQKKYFDLKHQEYMETTKEPFEHLDIQLTKLANGLLSGKYSNEIYIDNPNNSSKEKVLQEQEGISPRMIKSLVGKGHPEFQTNQQQDALEFLQWILQLIERNDTTKKVADSAANIFRFQLEERYQCSVSSQVSYRHRVENVVTLPVPLEKAINKQEWDEYERKQKEIREKQRQEQELKKQQEAAAKTISEALNLVENSTQTPLQESAPAPAQQGSENLQPQAPQPKKEETVPVRPRVKMEDCIDAFAHVEHLQGFYSSAVKQRVDAFKTTRVVTFPDYLIVSVRRFLLDGWVPRKLDVFIENAEEIDLSKLRGKGVQPNEVLLPDEEEEDQKKKEETPKLEFNEEFVQDLEGMGFSRNRCIRGVVNTKNISVEAAMNWIFDHAQDTDIDEPLPQLQKPNERNTLQATKISDESIQMLESMGFDRRQATIALRNTNGNTERAVDWLFSHMDEIEQLILQEDAAQNQQAQPPMVTPNVKLSHAEQANKERATLANGEGKYELIGFVSHIGTSTASGHYVCHLKKQNQWVIFNDRKVSACEAPPFDMGYIYVYARK